MTTRLADLIVPEVFAPYVIVRTKELSRLVQSGALVTSEQLNAFLNGPGLTINLPFYKDLANDPENISNDDPADKSSPYKIGTSSEVQVRLSRNNSWSSMDLNEALIGNDPMDAIAQLVASYWVRRLQQTWLATWLGVFADNAAAPGTGDTHLQNDLTVDVSTLNGGTFLDGVTNFTTEAFMDAQQTMGDAQGDLGLAMMHSVVYNRAKKNNLIDFIPDSINGQAMSVPTFLGKPVIVDDGMPNAGGVYQTWLFARGSSRLGQGSPKVPVAVVRDEAAGNGGGQEILHNRVEWAIHPVGHAYVGSPPAGGPSNAATTNNLANAASWQRRYPERKQIGVARLITREM